MRTAIVVWVAVALAISGCAGTDPPLTPGPTSVASLGSEAPRTTTEPPEEVETSSPGNGGTGGENEPSVFAGPPETPPGDVADFLAAIPGGGIEGPCIVNPPEVEPGIAMHETTLPTSVCGLGFIPGREVALLLRGPGGKEWTAQVTTDEYGAFEWEVEELASRLEGEYFASAAQDEAPAVEDTFNVQLNSLVAAVVPRYFRPGQATELVIAGGEPGQSVPVHLYRERAPDEGYDFVADLGPIVLNDNGQKRVDLRSRRGDERGKYMVVVDPDNFRIGYWFVLGPAT